MKMMETFVPARGGPTLAALAPDARFSLRAREAHADRIGAAIGLTLPARIGERAASGARECLRLGPDEWLVVGPEDDADAIASALAGIAANVPHALADIGDRELCYRLAGPGAAEIVAMGCPRDLRAIPPGSARRTVFDGASVILWRDGPDDFRLDFWRSFAPHACALIEIGIAELRAGL